MVRSLVLAALACALGCAKPYLDARPDVPPMPPMPAGVVHETESFAARDGTALFAQSWRPAAGPPRAVLIVMHGLRDHGDRYAPFAARLVERGYAVYAFDLRGHGRSAGRRVTIGSFDDYLMDFDQFARAVRAREPGRPLFAFGHSMGGLIVGLWAEEHPDLAGVVTSAPALRIDALPLVAAASRVAASVTPDVGGLAPDNHGFSSDPAVEADMERDPLIYQPPGPVGTAAGLVDGIERFWAGAHRLTMPLLLLHGTGDTLTAPAGSRELLERAAATDKTLRLYDGQAHDLVHEPRREEIVRDVLAWLDAHTGGGGAAFPAPDLGRELNGDAHKPSAAVAVEAVYRRNANPEDGGHLFGGALRTRFLLGRRLVWPLALDAELLGGDALAYRAALYPLGVGLVSSGGSTVSLAGGAGVSDIGGGDGFELPVALDAEVGLGPLRLLAWARLVWLPGDDPRHTHSDLPIGDELRSGLALRLGRSHRLWSTANFGAGPYLGVTLDLERGEALFGVVLGLHLWGGS
jgi:alpha-beta hydrolase superfamily lysophospholipase